MDIIANLKEKDINFERCKTKAAIQKKTKQKKQ